MSTKTAEIAKMIDMLPDSDKELAYELIRKLVLAWDPNQFPVGKFLVTVGKHINHFSNFSCFRTHIRQLLSFINISTRTYIHNIYYFISTVK